MPRFWTPEQYEAHQKRVNAWRKPAPEVVGNCEVVKLQKASEVVQPVILYPLVRKCREMRIAEPIPEYVFAKPRRWRFDYAWPMHMLACEIEGGLWTQGRHSRGKGAIADLEKYSEAAILGWRLIYATPQELDNGVCLDRVIRALTDREAA